jgi:hypothetical protein
MAETPVQTSSCTPGRSPKQLREKIGEHSHCRRQLTSWRINGVNPSLNRTVLGEHGGKSPGYKVGANHEGGQLD